MVVKQKKQIPILMISARLKHLRTEINEEGWRVQEWRCGGCWTTRKNTCPEQEWSPDPLKAEMLYNRQNANNKNTPETKQLIVTDAGCDNRERQRREEGICKWLDSAQKHLCTLINPWKKQERDLSGFFFIIQLHWCKSERRNSPVAFT